MKASFYFLCRNLENVVAVAAAGGAAGGGDEEQPDAHGIGDLRASVNTLLDAMRDLLSNIHLPEPPGNEADQSEDENHEWDWVLLGNLGRNFFAANGI